MSSTASRLHGTIELIAAAVVSYRGLSCEPKLLTDSRRPSLLIELSSSANPRLRPECAGRQHIMVRLREMSAERPRGCRSDKHLAWPSSMPSETSSPSVAVSSHSSGLSELALLAAIAAAAADAASGAAAAASAAAWPLAAESAHCNRAAW